MHKNKSAFFLSLMFAQKTHMLLTSYGVDKDMCKNGLVIYVKKLDFKRASPQIMGNRICLWIGFGYLGKLPCSAALRFMPKKHLER